MMVSINTPQAGEGFRVEVRGRHAGELKDFLMQAGQSAQPCPDSRDPGRACASCEAWAMVSALLATEPA